MIFPIMLTAQLFKMLLLSLLTLLHFVSGTLSQPRLSWEPATSKNNILFIFTDDQDLLLGSLNYLPTLRSRVKDVGKSNTPNIDHRHQA